MSEREKKNMIIIDVCISARFAKWYFVLFIIIIYSWKLETVFSKFEISKIIFQNKLVPLKEILYLSLGLFEICHICTNSWYRIDTDKNRHPGCQQFIVQCSFPWNFFDALSLFKHFTNET